MGLGGVAYCRGGLTVLTFELINIFIVLLVGDTHFLECLQLIFGGKTQILVNIKLKREGFFA